jgi:hypothetical protein
MEIPIMVIKPKRFLSALFFLISAITLFAFDASATTFKKLEKPPLEEHTFGIYVGSEKVGFYSQKFTEVENGYRVDATGGVKLKVMGFSKESSTKETYFVNKRLGIRSFDVSVTLNGVSTRTTGTKYDTSLRLKTETAGKVTEKQVKITEEILPGPALNIFPLMHDSFIGKTFSVNMFDPEEVRVQKIKISVMNEEKIPNGQSGLRMRNTLYPFVHNDIWVDPSGNTIWESVRDGLVITKYEISKILNHFK